MTKRIVSNILILALMVILFAGCAKDNAAKDIESTNITTENSSNILKKTIEPDESYEVIEHIFTEANGIEVKLSDYRGKNVIITMWATWCPPCLEELPAFAQALSEYEDLIVLAVDVVTAENIGSDYAKFTTGVVDFLKQYEGIVPLFDREGEVFKLYGGRAFPTNIIVNKKGELVYSRIGAFRSIDDMRNILNEKIYYE